MKVFDKLAIAYDNTIDWSSRLKREIPFILASLPSSKECRVLDIACGSGRHAVELAKNGHEVHAFDSSEPMVSMAKELAQKEKVRVSFQVADMFNIDEIYDYRFDLITCLGNSFALLPSFEMFHLMLQKVNRLLVKGGVLIFQVLNFEAVESQGIRFMPQRTGTLETGEKVTFSRFLDHTQADPERADLVLSAIIHDERDEPIVETQQVLRLTRETVEKGLIGAGFDHFEIYADYAKSPFHKEYDRNMVVRARP